MKMKRIAPCLWFDGQAEQAARYYVGIFENSKIVDISYFGGAGQEVHGRPKGSVMTVAFELDGQPITALNGGPHFKFNEAVSLQVFCDNQDEVDHYWEKLTAGGDAKAQQCGWLKDKFGLSWQVIPVALLEMIQDKDEARSQRAFQEMMQMKKFDIARLRKAFNG